MLLRVIRFVKPYRAFLVLVFFGVLGETVAELLQPWPLKLLFDHIFVNRPLPAAIDGIVKAIVGREAVGLLYFVLMAAVGVAALNAACSFIQDFFMSRVSHWVIHDLRRQLYWHIQRLSLAYHNERRMGDLMGTLTGDIEAVRQLLESAMIGFVINCLTLAGMIAIMLAIDWRFALLGLSIVPPLIAVIYNLTRRIKQASRDVRRREGAVAAVAQEVLSSILVVQAFTREDYEQARFERENEQRILAGIRARTLQAKLRPVAELMVAGGTALVLWYGARRVLAGSLMPGALLVFLNYLSRLYKPIKELSKQLDLMSRAGAGVERILGILDTEREVRDFPGAKPALQFRGRIEFKDVSFAYRAGEPVLKDITFTVEPGEVVALVGSTGGGKTTLVSLVPRFHDPYEGRVCIDGRDVRSYTLNSLRCQIGLVLQDTVLFYGTIRDNIAYGRPEAGFDEVVAAAKAANAHEFIEKLPNGYDTLVGERGVTLSGGQRQRMAIARTILRDSPIILLDEPTTGLDASAESLVLEGLKRLIAGRTAIIIAHRLATVSHAGTILVIEGGKILEKGSHQELLSRGGRYAELYELQFRGQASVIASKDARRSN